MEVEGKLAIVTGGAGGIGAELVRGLLEMGATVVAVDIDRAALHDLAIRHGDQPLRTLYVDVSDELAVSGIVQQASLEYGAPAVLINNAGVLRDALLVAVDGNGVREFPTALWTRVLATNLAGPFFMTRSVVSACLKSLPCAMDRTRAVIVNISSVVAEGNVGQTAYAASKAALDAMTRTWASELGPHGIRVAGIAPGLVDTPMIAHVSQGAVNGMLSRSSIRRLGRPKEIWIALRFILECDFFTGRVVAVDGGLSFS